MIYPTFYFEKKLWKRGFGVVAGCDEVGRGCFAGPVVTAVCAFDKNTIYTLKGLPLQGVKINDSKKLTARQREKADVWIRENTLAWGIGKGSISEINKLGMTKATNSAFRRAIKDANQRLGKSIEYLLIDAFYIPYVRGMKMPRKTQRKRNSPASLRITSKTKKQNEYKFFGNQLAIINGDEKAMSIAAASIIAKVYRDKLMVKLSQKHKVYDWDKNKGYGTLAHRRAIQKHGLTKHHRKKFVESWLKNMHL